MAAAITFYAGESFPVNVTGGSGLGFYSASGFGGGIPVGQYNGRTFITNAGGTVEGAEVNNVQYLSSTGAILGQTGSGINLLNVPNYLATLNARFTYDSAVRTQNAKVYIYDRTDKDNPASGVTTRVAEIVHTSTSQAVTGSGNSTWTTFLSDAGPVTPLDLIASPGTSGLRPSGSGTTDTRHDWYLAVSVSPDQAGSITQFGLWFECEYL